MEKLDLKKDLKFLYLPSAKKVELVEVPELQFAMLDGVIQADETPGESPGFQEAMLALYGISYTLKFTAKLRKQDPIDYPVMALEALWWVEGADFDIAHKEKWFYTAMILQPDLITPGMFQEGLHKLCEKHPSPSVDRLRLEKFREGLSIQTMHIGPYAAEPATLERMFAFARQNGLHGCGRHHEIYLGDPRRAAPEKLKTVLRHPVERI
jgi:hypothetical protein